MKLKKFAFLGAAGLAAVSLVACGGGATPATTTQGTTTAEGKTIKLEYSGTGSNKEFNLQLFEDFKADRKAKGDKNTYEITYVEHGPDKVDSEVLDWVVGPDVFEFASDKITELYKKGALAKVTGSNAEFVEESNSELGVSLSKFNDQIYAYPYTGDNTYYLQYDKSKLTADDVSSVEKLLAKAEQLEMKVGYALKTAFWSAGALFTFGADYKVTYTEDGDLNSITADFNTDKGVKAAKAIYKVLNSPVWQDAMEAPTPTNNLVACFAGTWDIAAYKEALGENYACAPMPTVTIDGETKHLGAFLGGKLLGVNPQRSNGNKDQARLVAAHQLAVFLSGKECQLKRFDNQGVAPCNKAAAAEQRVQNSENVKVLIEQAKFAHAQTAVPAGIWTAPTVLVEGMLDGTITEDGIEAACATLNESIKGAN